MNSYLPSLAIAEETQRLCGTPTFLTDAETLRRQSQRIQKTFAGWEKTKIFYAIKANCNPAILKVLRESGIYGIDTVSPHEVRWGLELGLDPEHIIFTGSNPSTEELRMVSETGVLINAGSLSELRRVGEIGVAKEVALRLNPGIAEAEHDHLRTGNADSKFGIALDEIDAAKTLLTKHKLRLKGLHIHIGSGLYNLESFETGMKNLLEVAPSFGTFDFIDFGGGYGIYYEPEQGSIPIEAFGAAAVKLLEGYQKEQGVELELRIEPGKFLVGESTCIITEVTTMKHNAEKIFAGVNTGMNHLVRPVTYGSYHHIVNVSRPEGETGLVTIAGNICEGGDLLGKDRTMVIPKEGDLLAIMTTGGYGSAMSSNYNMWPMAAEAMVDDGVVKLTKKRQTFEQITENYLR